MTLNTRNKFLLAVFVTSITFLVIFSIITLVGFIKGSFLSIPSFTRILPMESENFFLKNSLTFGILSILVLLLYIPIFSYFLYTTFEKTKSPETIYLMGFLIACLLQSLKILVVLLDLWETPSALLILIGRIEITGRLSAPIFLLFSVMLSDIEKVQDADKNICLVFGASLFCASILPINSTKIFSNFTLSCGFDGYINFYVMLCAVSTILASIFTSKQRDIKFFASPTPYYILIIAGYTILSTSDNFLFLIAGTLFLSFGSYGILSKLHAYYLWK